MMNERTAPAIKKKELIRELIGSNPGLLACPMCRGELRADDSYSLVCPKRHSFDISRSGSVNLLASQVNTGYGMDMLEARNRVCKGGFFDGLIQEILDAATDYVNTSESSVVTVLDAGCGEGSQLERLAAGLAGKTQKPITGVGVDISREGIRIAAREYPGILWCVADLARLPVAKESIDVVLNVLSPAKYVEFGRVLKSGGLLIKAAPGDDYMKELRQALYPVGEKEYSGERVLKHFSDFFPVADMRHVRYEVSAEGENLRDLIKMTPLAWQASEAGIQAVIELGRLDITVDFNVLIGAKPEDGRMTGQ